MTEQEFIEYNRDADVTNLRLRYSGKELVFNLEDALVQIEARKKCSKKLSEFISIEGFRFPALISGEQATDQAVADFHASLTQDATSLIDLTAGLGIDAMTIARQNRSIAITAVEIDAVKAECLEKNVSVICNNADFRVINKDCREVLQETDSHFDLLFADPARRDNKQGRVYALKDCLPDVTVMMDDIFRVSDRFMFKVSPMLDISRILKEVPGITEIYAVSLKGELKEILLVGQKDGEVKKLSSVMIYERGDIEEFEFSPELLYSPAPMLRDATDLKTGMYLYEPDASVMKFGCWGVLAARFPGLFKLSSNTSVFVSEWEYLTFPGRVTKIEAILTKKDYKSLKGEKFNIVTRNYPIRAEELKKKIATKDGGENFLYGVGVGAESKPMLLKCIRI